MAIFHENQKLLKETQTDEFSIVDDLNVVWNIRQYIFQLEGDTAKDVKKSFTAVLGNNPGLSTYSRPFTEQGSSCY